MSQAQILGVSYSVWKQLAQTNSFDVYYHEDDGVANQGSSFCGTDRYIYTTRIVDETWDDFNTNFPSEDRTAVARRDDAIAHIVGLSGIMHEALDNEGKMRVSIEPRKEGSSRVAVSHRWNDKTTWYQQSTRVEGETLTDSGDGLTFNSLNENWMDLIHGKIYREDLVSSSYNEVVKIDGVTATRRAPWATSGGDYQVNYANGTITFFTSQSGNTITADYSHENGSLFTIALSEGKKRLWVEYSEIQFSSDINLKDTIHFQLYGKDLQNPTGPKVAYAPATTYKIHDNFIEEANGCFPTIPTFPGDRGFTKIRNTFPFAYSVVKELHKCWGLEIRIWLENDTPYEGEYATATFYCTEWADCPIHAVNACPA